ncbi:hypothetical protein [Ferrimonas senticii]|uniref:hypothetical protein n=1 Tax=Ferrimonas senticii TaxID=394566 RepID=UPI000424AC14|nr:hypothetical protein [Ferrimonas senticii]
MIQGNRHKRWLHPANLPYLWVGLLCIVLAPAVAAALLALWLLLRAGRCWQQKTRH